MVEFQRKLFGSGEPTLILRASDPLAPSAVMEYARELEDAGVSKFEEMFKLAYEMRAWAGGSNGDAVEVSGAEVAGADSPPGDETTLSPPESGGVEDRS